MSGEWFDPTMKYWQGRDGRYHEMRGENARSAKLVDEQVAAIKAAPTKGRERVSTRALSRHYEVAECTIRRIREGVTWTHVPVGEWPPESWLRHGEGVRSKGSS